jgi:DNA-binding response OmpR family regulator
MRGFSLSRTRRGWRTGSEGLRDQGIAVDIAYDGNEAASRLHVNPYDVVVLDRDRPGIHGDTLCRMITESDEPAMILMPTAAGTPDDRVAGLTLGADDYLPKPFHFPELVLRVRALGRANLQHSPGRYERAGSSSIRSPVWSAAPAARSTSHAKNAPSSKRC